MGISLGLVIHIGAGIFGLVALMASPTLFMGIKFLGGAYLIYLGWQGLRAKPQAVEDGVVNATSQRSLRQIVQMGFWCNVLNPKVPLYFLSVFTVMIPPSTSQVQLFGIGAVMMILTFLWFSTVALIFSNSVIQGKFRRLGHWLDRVVGGLFIGFGLKVLVSAQSR